eukprot:1192213-Prorocentrum_minimum.AAC.2
MPPDLVWALAQTNNNLLVLAPAKKPAKPKPEPEETGKKGKKKKKAPKKKAPTTIWGQKFLKSALPRYGIRNLPVSDGKKGKKKGKKKAA